MLEGEKGRGDQRGRQWRGGAAAGRGRQATCPVWKIPMKMRSTFPPTWEMARRSSIPKADTRKGACSGQTLSGARVISSKTMVKRVG